jgi:hypothetical protein
VAKVGRTTGLTRGAVSNEVTKTCVNKPVPEGILLCQSEANYRSRRGDSGSAVFQPVGDPLVFLVGIHWGGPEGVAGTRVFSPASGIERDLGALTLCSPLFDDVSLC